MKRRTFLQATLAAPALGTMPAALRQAWAAEQGDGWRTYEVVTKVEILNPSGISRAWVPLPWTAKTNWHNALGNKFTGNASQAKVVADGKYGAEMVYAEWQAGEQAPVIEVVSRFATRDRAVDVSKTNPGAPKLSAAEIKAETAATELIPTDGIVRDTAQDITRGIKTDVEKARAIYEWIVENTFRDPKVRGCGWGDIKGMLETRNFGGKCGDLNAMFVGLVR